MRTNLEALLAAIGTSAFPIAGSSYANERRQTGMTVAQVYLGVLLHAYALDKDLPPRQVAKKALQALYALNEELVEDVQHGTTKNI
jgi:hypothetical protein